MLARFFSNNRGGVVPLMAVVAVPLMASVGIAVDYSRIMRPERHSRSLSTQLR